MSPFFPISNFISSQTNPQNSGYCLSMMLSFLVGVTYLLSFYVLIQPTDYWRLQFTDFPIEFYIVLVYVTSSFICSLGAIFVPNNMYNVRITSGLLLQAACLAIIPMLSNYYKKSPSYSASSPFELSSYSLSVLICTALCGLATSLCHGSVLYLSAQFPGGIQRSLQLGMGISPIAALTIRLGTFYSYSFQDTITATSVYFYAVALLCFITSIAFQGKSLSCYHLCMEVYIYLFVYLLIIPHNLFPRQGFCPCQ